MIDWLTCKVRVASLPPFGRRLETDEEGCILVERDLPALLESHDTRVFVVPVPVADGYGLLISGNPTKYFQGHNVWGLDSWVVVTDFLSSVCERLGVGRWHIVGMSRLDITHSYVLPTELDVQAALQALSNTTAERWGRPVVKAGTVYYGHPKRARLVVYSKAPEFRRHNRASAFSAVELPPILRLELRLGRNWFDENRWYDLASDEFRLSRWREMVDRIRISELESLDISAMPRRCQKVYGLWVAGVDLAQIYSRSSLYRYAAELREFGIDIWAPYEPSKVVHLRRVLRSRPLTSADVLACGLPLHRVA